MEKNCRGRSPYNKGISVSQLRLDAFGSGGIVNWPSAVLELSNIYHVA